MRKEAALKMWWELYETACRIEELKPWKYLTKDQYVVIQLKDEKEPVFLRILGNGQGEEKEIQIYPGFKGWQDLTMIAELGTGLEEYLSEDYAMSDRRTLICRYGKKSDMMYSQQEISKALNLPMAKEEMWPNFISYRSRYIPFSPDQDEVLMMTEAIRNLFMCIRALEEKKLPMKWEENERLCRIFNVETGLWNMFPAKISKQTRPYMGMQIQKEELKEELKNTPEKEQNVQIDFYYTHIAESDEEAGRPRNPFLFVAADEKTGKIITRYFLKPEETELSVVSNFLLSHLKQQGRMRKITSGNPWIIKALEQICQELGIETELGRTEVLEELMKKIENRM